ncbi:MAG TPA: PDZ domain-containing protein, partial [bacterium]
PPYLMPDVLMGDTQYELFVAYPISWIEKVGNDIVQVGQVRRGWIGVIGSHGNNGLTVTRIKDNSPGQQAGLTVGDVIVKYSSTAVNSVTQLARLVEYTAPGQSVPLEFVRNGQLQTVDILIGEKHHHKTAMPPPENPETMMYFEWPTGSEMVERNQALENRVELLEKELEKVKKLLEAK